MIAPPSGLERVRWKESARSPHPATTPRILAPRAAADARLSSTSAPPPSAMTKPSRSRENGRHASSGASLWVDSADSSEKRMSDSGIDRAVRADGERRLGLAAPDRLDAHLDRGRAGGASGGDRNRRAARAEAVGDPIGEAAHQKEALKFRSAVEGSLDQGAIGDGRVGRQIGGECLATRPIELGRRRCNEQGPGERAYRPDGGLIERFHRRHLGQREGKVGRVGARRQHEIDGAGDLRPQALRRKAANATDAGLAGRRASPSSRPCRRRAKSPRRSR